MRGMRRRGMEEHPASDSHQVVVPLKHVARNAPGIMAACGWLWLQNPKNGAWFRSFVKANSTELCISADEKVGGRVMT